jgi:hypothetical protein
MKISRRIFIIAIFGTSLFSDPALNSAQANLINFNNWTSETSSPYLNQDYYQYLYSAEVESYNSADFTGEPNGDQTGFYNFQGNIRTVPGTMYEISFTAVNGLVDEVNLAMSFGNLYEGLDLNSAYYNDPKYGRLTYPVDFNFYYEATSDNTLMNFYAAVDSGDGVFVYNVAVTPVPDKQSARFLLGISLMSLFIFRWRVKFDGRQKIK